MEFGGLGSAMAVPAVLVWVLIGISEALHPDIPKHPVLAT
jgi:hypothetical protein